MAAQTCFEQTIKLAAGINQIKEMRNAREFLSLKYLYHWHEHRLFLIKCMLAWPNQIFNNWNMWNGKPLVLAFDSTILWDHIYFVYNYRN